MRLTSHIGLIIGVSVLVAAGIAVYESPQFQEWVTTSRRKIALALHNLGDEIQPRTPLREDISMTEETGDIAEERRRIARAEIMRRGAYIESRRDSQNQNHAHNSFDALVDQDGNLRDQKHYKDEALSHNHTAKSTGLDLGISGPVRRNGNTLVDADSPTSPARSPLHVQIPSSATSNCNFQPSQFTPTSDDARENVLFDPFSPNSPIMSSDSSHTEDHEHVYYAHPDAPANTSDQNNVLVELGSFDQSAEPHDVSAAPSTSGSFSHVGDADDLSSDGTLSDLGVGSADGFATPASWSDVGSVVSNEDAGHHQLL